METIHLYTVQHRNCLFELEKKGYIRNKEIYVRLHQLNFGDFFIERYREFVRHAEQIVPRPDGTEYPIWCSVTKESCLMMNENQVALCLSVPRDQVIYFDGVKWDYVLNNLYIPKDEEDARAFKQEIKALGVSDQFQFIQGKYQGVFPEIEAKIRASWDRVFEIDHWHPFSIQANLWEIQKDWIQHIVYPGQHVMEVAADMENTFPPQII